MQNTLSATLLFIIGAFGFMLFAVSLQGTMESVGYFGLDRSDLISPEFFSFPQKEDACLMCVSNAAQIRHFELKTENTLYSDEEKFYGQLFEETKDGLGIVSEEIGHKIGGTTRKACNPPVIKLYFDDLDLSKAGDAGKSFFSTKTNLNYSEIRFTSECDLWEGKYGSGNLIREDFIAWLFNSWGVATPETIGYAKVKLDSSDSKIRKGIEYNYLIQQRELSSGDEIPFLVQHNFSDYLEDKTAKKVDLLASNPLDKIVFERKGDWESINIDSNTAMRYALLTRFIGLEDRGFFYNESYGMVKDTNLWQQVPSDFDMSFECKFNAPKGVNSQILGLNGGKLKTSKENYASFVKELFDNPKNLSNMLVFIDKFPFADQNKTELQNFIKIKFYLYALYFASDEFADELGVNKLDFENLRLYQKEALTIGSDSKLKTLCIDINPQKYLIYAINGRFE